MDSRDMTQNQLSASIRSKKGKSANQKLRQAGNIPAVLYGPRGNILLEMAEESTRHLLEKMSGMHELVPINVTDSAKWRKLDCTGFAEGNSEASLSTPNHSY
jgi:Ribosomal L25p family.